MAGVTTAQFQRARSPQQQEQRRAAILATARGMLDRQPPAEISLRELSRQVGLSKSNLVRYFPTREAVFLAVLTEDWDAWLAAVEAALPAAGGPAGEQRVAAAVAGTLARHERLCALLASCQAVLEHNVPAATAREFKAAALARLTRLAALVGAALPQLSEAQGFEFAGITWALTAGAWPMARPPEALAAILAEPAFAPMRVDFTAAMTRALALVLSGLTRQQQAGAPR